MIRLWDGYHSVVSWVLLRFGSYHGVNDAESRTLRLVFALYHELQQPGCHEPAGKVEGLREGQRNLKRRDEKVGSIHLINQLTIATSSSTNQDSARAVLLII
jgi:hypothetical protein